MVERSAEISALIDEYRAIIGDVSETATLEERISREADWTPRATEHLLLLAKNYGSFMLRNALALSIALEIEDGELGF